MFQSRHTGQPPNFMPLHCAFHDMRSVDVAVIGSGVGGMCGAARLADEGFEVAVYERMPYIGGRFSTVEYRDHKVTTGGEMIALGDVFQETFDEVGAEFPVTTGVKAYYKMDGQNVNADEAGLMGLLREAADDEAEAEKVMAATKRGLSWFKPLDTVTLEEWVRDITDDDGVYELYHKISAAFIGINADEVPAREFFNYLEVASSTTGTGIAKGGNIELWHSLGEVVRDNGGTIETNTTVQDIVVEDGSARGVVVPDGDDSETKIRAECVVSNAGPQATIEMAGREHFTPDYLEAIDATRSPGVIMLQVESEEALMEDPGPLVPLDTERVCFLLTPTLMDPSLSPEGKHHLIAYATLPESDKPETSEVGIERAIEDLEDLFPGRGDRWEILRTPTFHGDWPVYRAWPGDNLPQKTPVQDLYNVGDGVKPPGWSGISANAQTAKLVVDDILARHDAPHPDEGKADRARGEEA